MSVIVVCWNARQHLAACFDSLHHQTYAETEVLAVDNGSTDGTREYIESAYPWVRVWTMDHNSGYAAANNAGFRVALGKYLVVLNPDTEVEPDFVKGLVAAVDLDGGGLATSRVCLFQYRDRVNACGNEVHVSGLGFCRGLDQPARLFDERLRVASVSGCAFMVRRDVLDRIGGFDDDYFLYGEDTDLSVRAAVAGYGVIYAPGSVVYHKYALRMTPQKFFFLERNRRLTLLKNLKWGTLAALLPVILATGLLMWVYCLLHGPGYLWAKLRTHCWMYRNWRHVMEKRARVQSIRLASDRQVVQLLSSILPLGQVVSEGLLSRLAAAPVNLAYRLLAAPVRLLV